MSKRAFLCTILVLLYALPLHSADAAVPQIVPIENDSASVGTTYRKVPKASAGEDILWTKEFGPDDMTVDPNSGEVSWAIPPEMPREAFHVGVRASNADGSAYMTWIVKVGGGNYIYVGPGEKYTTISAGTAAAVAGDTIVVRDGRYTGTVNSISNFQGGRGSLPPSGTASYYTTIMAEHPGQVTLDGAGTTTMIGINGNYSARQVGTQGYAYNASYIAVKGFVVTGTSGVDPHISEVTVMHGQFIKLVDCGAFGRLGKTAPFTVFYSNHVTTEGAYAWGLGRMGIVYYKCDYNIIRRSVVRIDRSIMANPIGGIDLYACQHSRVQNSLVVDQDQREYYLNYTNAEGAFVDESGSSPGEIHVDNIFRKCLAVNVANIFTTTQASPTGVYPPNDPATFDNCVGWDLKAIPNSVSGTSATSWISGSGAGTYNQLTLGALSSPWFPLFKKDAIPIGFNGWNETQRFTNSIVAGAKDYNGAAAALFFKFEAVDRNNLYNVGSPNIQNSSVVTNTVSTNPLQNGLLYLPRIEADSPLQGGGGSGVRMGADTRYMTGKSCTLFGEAMFDSEVGVPMWPFPHEDMIRSKMAEYAYDGRVTGARGFAAPGQTLTNYIWGYLGNTVPPFNLVATPSSASVTLRWSPNTSSSTLTGYKVYVGTLPGVYSFGEYANGKPVGLVTRHRVEGLAPNTPYYFAVTAVDNVTGESGFSYGISVATALKRPNPPVLEGVSKPGTSP